MLSRSAFALLVAGAAGSAVAQETSEKVNALYFHPVSLIATLSIPESPIYAALTYERELNGGKSIVFQPVIFTGSVESEEDAWVTSKESIFMLSLRASFRKYFNGDVSEGIYVAPALEYTYLSSKTEYKGTSSTDYNDEKTTINGVSILGYIGYRGKWDGITLYVDAGLGRMFASGESDSDSESDNVTASGSGLDFGLNFGLGFPF